MASRICGICAVSHKCAALNATESALGVDISDQARLLRRLAYHGEVLSSHILHIYFLAGPDFLDVPSFFSLVERDREMVQRAMRLKKLGYDLSKVVAGRRTHPVAMVTGGFTFVHQAENLESQKGRRGNCQRNKIWIIRNVRLRRAKSGGNRRSSAVLMR